MNLHLPRLPWAAPKPVPADVLDQLIEARVEAAVAREALRHIPKREPRKDSAAIIEAKAAKTRQLRAELGLGA